MTSAIILDKSFLQGTKTSRIQELAAAHRLVVSDALFYELLTAPEPGRTRCFAKFPQTENPVDLVNHIGTMMRIEIDTHLPSGRPSEHRENLRFQFNPNLVSPSYVLPDQAQVAVKEQTTQLQSDVVGFLEQVSLVPTFFPNLLTGNTAEQKLAHAEAEGALLLPSPEHSSPSIPALNRHRARGRSLRRVLCRKNGQSIVGFRLSFCSQ